MIQNERFLRIIEYLKENKTANLKKIAELNDVSIDTVRRDFKELEKEGMLRRVRGGAIFHNVDITRQDVDIRTATHSDEKKEVASLLSSFILDGQAVGLNSGTTCVEVARFLTENYKKLTVITNNLQAVDVLAKAKNFIVIIPGGELDSSENAIYGEICEESILKYNIDVAIFGAHAISLEKGVTDFRIKQQGVIKALLKSSKKKIAAVDSSKFDKIAYVNVCDLKDIDMVLSDSKLSESLKEKYEKQGIKLITPK